MNGTGIHRPGFLRPVPARWFELLTLRDDLTLAVETLARSRRVELDTRSEAVSPVLLPDLQERLDEYNHLAQRYQGYWPSEELTPSEVPGNPADSLEAALRRLRSWRAEADPLVHELEDRQAEQSELRLLGSLLQTLHDSRLQLSLLPGSGPAVAARAFLLPPRTNVEHRPPGVLVTRTHGERHDFLIAVGPVREIETLEQELNLLKGRRMLLPSWLRPDARQSLDVLTRRLDGAEQRIAALGGELNRLAERHRLHGALGDIARIEWFLTHVGELPVTENFAWVTGWGADPQPERLQEALDKAGVRGLLRYTEPPQDKEAPMVLNNPAWAQPFELFARLLGTPSATEADPSRLLVVIVPLLFGYMFGDVGQGAVLFIIGLVLARRYPALRLLIPAGLSSLLFGFLFGSVFSREGIVPALWLHPLDEPLLVLGVPLVAGIGILLLGLVLNGVESLWRGESRLWWWLDAPLILLYLALAATLFLPYAALVATAAVLWHLGGRLVIARGELSVLGSAVGRLLESMFQLLVNTLSFTRVGAFALAHAGLSAAVIALADTAGHPVFAALVMVLGNLVIIVLEGLVVSIQITRLVLFEFFIRFLHGEGRQFRPLAAPPATREAKRGKRSPS